MQWLGHRIIYTTLPHVLNLSNWISLLEPLFAVVPVTLMNYFILCHPNGWIISDPCNCNPQLLSVHVDKEALQSFSSMNKMTDLNEVMEKTGRSQQPPSLSADPLIQHQCMHRCLQTQNTASCLYFGFSTAEVPWQQSRDNHWVLVLSEGTFSSPWGRARDCVKMFLKSALLPNFYNPAWSSFLYPLLSSSPAESIRPFTSTHMEHCSFLHLRLSLLSALICGRCVEREPQAQMTRLYMVYDVYTHALEQTIRTRSKLL